MLTDYVIGEFGLEPGWRVRLVVCDDRDMPVQGAEATITWPPHYRDAMITTLPHHVLNRTEWVNTLIHEIVHMLTATTKDYLVEVSSPKHLLEIGMDGYETDVSILGNIVASIFLDAHHETIDKWLK